jgi:hypothetical protein
VALAWFENQWILVKFFVMVLGAGYHRKKKLQMRGKFGCVEIIGDK